MSTLEEKLSLLKEMIEFARVDGVVHDRECQFLYIVANHLKVSSEILEGLFNHDVPHIVIKSEQQRILQFYRLALLMHTDGILHVNEQKAIREIGINMGLSPFAMKGVLREMENSPTGVIDTGILTALFRAQHN